VSAGGEEEPVLLVDLGEVDGRGSLAPLQRAEGLRGGRLDDVRRPARERLDRRLAGRGDGVRRLEPLCLEESAGEGGDQWRVEGGEPRELDADGVRHGTRLAAAGIAARTSLAGSDLIPGTRSRCA
jgi:hypothetical protein